MCDSFSSSFKTNLHCCSIESYNSTRNLFACGMYELIESSQSRKGSIALCDKREVLSTVETSAGVLDMKWTKSTLACALSNGMIELYELIDNDETVELTLSSTCSDGCDDGLALSVCWDCSTEDCQEKKIAVSTQNGSLYIYMLTSSGLQLMTSFISVHSLSGEIVPAWITAFNPHNRNTVLSGGDDLCLKLWDVRSSPHSPPIYSSSRHYDAGVTSGQYHPSPSLPHLFAVGSYDCSIKLWDERNMKNPLHSIETGLTSPCASLFARVPMPTSHSNALIVCPC
jgi:diphthine methyl ester acylhydrolase